MVKVELIYEKTCPNIAAAREQLTQAFKTLAMQPVWQEWEVSATDAPQHIHGYGSPTILVNGQDVSRAVHAGDDFCCRIYPDSKHKGVPALQEILAAIENA